MRNCLFLLLLAPILVLGAYLRLADLGGPSLWLDEILHLQVTRSLAEEPWYRHLTGVREIKGGTENGALYYRLQIWGQMLAPGETGARLFPAIFGILSLPLMALTGRLLGGRLVALVATFLLAVSPLHVYFSREGRPYYLLMAMALLLLYALLRRGSRTGLWIAWLGCPLVTYAGIHSVPVLLSVSIVSAFGLGLDLRAGRGLGRSPYLLYLGAAILSLGLAYGLYMTRSDINAPALVQTAEHAGIQQSPNFLSPLSRRSLETFLASMTTSGHPAVLMQSRSWALLALALVGLVAGARSRASGKTLTAAAMFFLPAAISIAALLSVGRWYGMRYTSAALPAFLLLVAVGISTAARWVGNALASRRWPAPIRATAGTRVAAGLILLLLVAPNLRAAMKDPYRKLDWREVARFFDSVALEGEPVVVPNGWPQICLDHYLRELGATVEFVTVWESVELAEAAVDKYPHGWLLTAGFRRSNEVRAWMHNFVPVLKKTEEEMDLFFFPDFPTLLKTRFAGHKGTVFEQKFAAMGRRFELAGGESGLLGRGWSFPETNGQGTSFRWALGHQAELGLPVGPPRDTSLRFRALAFGYPGAPPQTLELRLNDGFLASVDLPPTWSEHQIEVPAAAWSTGANVLYLRFAHSASPTEVLEGSGDPRQLSAAFDYLEVAREEYQGPKPGS